MGKLKKCAEKKADTFYVIVRVVTGLLFVMIGAGKLFGLFGGNQVESLFSLGGLAGVLEVFGGTLVLLGLFTRTGALLAMMTMLVAFLMHTFGMIGDGGFVLNPLVNKGERALLYLLLFMTIFVKGNGKYSLEERLKK